MSVQTINLGTAGTQSGDKVRDAFGKVNDNFANFQLSDLKGYYKYFSATEYDTVSGAWQDTSTLISSVPAGTYLIFCSAQLISLDGGGDIAQPEFMLTDTSNNSLGIHLIAFGSDGYEVNCAGMSQVTMGSSFSIKGRYKCNHDFVEFGIRVQNITILLLKVG